MMRFKFSALFFLLIGIAFNLDALVNLDSRKQSFVLETKKIKIPDYPDAFNPSIVRWNGSILMSFRIRDPLTKTTNQIGLIWLDEKFNPLGKVKILNIKDDGPNPRIQEPRLLTVGDCLFIVFSANPKKNSTEKFCRMFMGQVLFDGENFSVEECEPLLFFKDANKQAEEKNWVPFDYKGNLLLAYSLNPHLIFRPEFGSKSCETFSLSQASIKWKWGQLRGGAPAILEGDEYLGFFHSSIDVATVQSKGKVIQHYFMGAYAFSSEFPFALTRISPEPIIAKSFYNGPAYDTWKPLLVVYPGGYISNEDFIWISYGRQDHEAWIVKLNKKGLLDSLIPVTTVTSQ